MYNTYLEKIKPLYEELDIAFFSGDEIVFLLPKGKDGHVVETHLARLIKDDGDFRVTLFYLQGYALYAKHRDGSEHKVCTFFQKSSDEPGKYKGGSSLYNKIIYRLLRGEKITENDRLFINNDCMAEFKDEFYIKEI